MAKSKTPWPKLSETLHHERHPCICQCCGVIPLLVDGKSLEIWREHDDEDQPTNVWLVLCFACAKRIIEPHPRLYSKEPENKPIPGTIPYLCVNCQYRDHLSCTHADLTANGGPGLKIAVEPPMRAFVDGTRGGRRTGWQLEVWSRPANSCAGKIAAEVTE